MEQQQSEVKSQRFAALIEDDDYHRTRVQRGSVYESVILSIGDNGVIVDLGAKRDGIIPSTDLESLDNEYCASLQVGDHAPVVVLERWGRDDGIIVSLKQGLLQRDWLRAEELSRSGEICQAEVKDLNRGGVVVPFGHLRGFVPNSQLASVQRGLRGERLQRAKEDLIGQVLHLTVIEVDQRRRRLVFSERNANRAQRQQLLEELTEGEVRTGIVRNLVSFGAFVDLGGLDGLIHISELDWQHVTHPSEVLNVDDEVQVIVLSVDRERERIGLSRKQLLPNSWDLVAQDLSIGQTVEGTVTGTTDFGTFVDLGEGIEGLVHISEMPEGETTLADLQAGSVVATRVLNVDHTRHRIALSLRQLEDT